MKEKLTTRLEQLRTDYQKGEQMLQELQGKQANVEQTMLRIAGAIQVLEEILALEEASAEVRLEAEQAKV